MEIETEFAWLTVVDNEDHDDSVVAMDTETGVWVRWNGSKTFVWGWEGDDQERGVWEKSEDYASRLDGVLDLIWEMCDLHDGGGILIDEVAMVEMVWSPACMAWFDADSMFPIEGD